MPKAKASAKNGSCLLTPLNPEQDPKRQSAADDTGSDLHPITRWRAMECLKFQDPVMLSAERAVI